MLNVSARTSPVYREITTLWLRKGKGDSRIFRCHICGYKLFKYEGYIFRIVPGDANNSPKEGIESEMIIPKIVKAPFYVQCKGKSFKYGDCPAEYLVEGVVENG